MTNSYFEEDYAEDDYVGADIMAIDALPPPPQRSDSKSVFIEKSDAWIAAMNKFALQCDAVAVAMSNNATNATSITVQTIGVGAKTFTVEASKSYLPGMTVRAASTASPTTWMQGDVTAYDFYTGALSIVMNAVQGSGTIDSWTLSLSAPGTSGGSLTQDFDVKSLKHAIGGNIASASTIDLSAATGNLAHVTGNNPISAATMTAGKDVWVIFDGTPTLNYHATNHKLNSGGLNALISAGDAALYTFDGTTVRVFIVKASGNSVVAVAPPLPAPVGSGLVHFGSTAPTNYLTVPTTPTNLNRTTYSALFAAIGTTWGAGDGTTTFGMPWLAADYAMVQASSNVGSTTTGEVKSHSHNTQADSAGTGGNSPTGPVGSTNMTKPTTSTGGAANLAAGTRVLLCVKYQ
ncbi:Phage Tail Collar Domain [Nitrosospira sp. Nsp11]|uniref:tail fiber protein n=1 Tax=Nitrosospira sp. Nsp11 TaxID=1855338 RepID=UPI0009193D4E|nr:tail fiber protein [Nitrosospira sp. Nsp11]SHL10025.1 Phage Tail Collar Domain [Nitrosospira sp. Nsp11]